MYIYIYTYIYLYSLRKKLSRGGCTRELCKGVVRGGVRGLCVVVRKLCEDSCYIDDPAYDCLYIFIYLFIYIYIYIYVTLHELGPDTCFYVETYEHTCIHLLIFRLFL